MSSERRLIAALDNFGRHRAEGVRSKRHVEPLIEFAAAELRSRGLHGDAIRREVTIGLFYKRKVDLVVKAADRITIVLLVLTQSGSVRKNLNNRRRDIVGDLINLRAALPNARLGFIYLLRADEEATTARRHGGTSPIDELGAFLTELQIRQGPLDNPLLDAAALIAADHDSNGRIHIAAVPETVDVLSNFFDKLVATIPNYGRAKRPPGRMPKNV